MTTATVHLSAQSATPGHPDPFWHRVMLSFRFIGYLLVALATLFILGVEFTDY